MDSSCRLVRPGFSLDCCIRSATRSIFDEYNGLKDRNLSHFFQRPKLRKHLRKMRLINRLGELLDNPMLDPVHTCFKGLLRQHHKSNVVSQKSFDYKSVAKKGDIRSSGVSMDAGRETNDNSNDDSRSPLPPMKRVKVKHWIGKKNGGPEIKYIKRIYIRERETEYDPQGLRARSPSPPHPRLPKGARLAPISSTELQRIFSKYKRPEVAFKPLKVNSTLV